MKKPVHALEKITPTTAKAWLVPDMQYDKNRTYQPHHAADLAREMTADRWTYSNDAICFHTDGRLLNGQHRLNAIVISGKAQEMFVIRGMTEEDFRNMDCGKRRQNHERLHLLNDRTQNRIVCQAIREFLRVSKRQHGVISSGEIDDEFLDKDAAWTWVGTEFVGMTPKLKKAGVQAAFGIYRFVNAEKAAVFMDGYRNGAGMTEESPILKLRNMALIGSYKDVEYWRVVTLMRAHLQNRVLKTVLAASEDMLGNKNPAKAVAARSVKSLKGAETLKKKRNGGSESGAA